MSKPAAPDAQGTSTRPYLIRALHDWCTDNGFTPYLAVFVDERVQVPAEYVKNHEIVLNVGFEATSGLKLGNEFIEFRARFGGVARDIVVPVDHVVAIYARENGQGMAFPVPADVGSGTRPGGAGAAAPQAAGPPGTATLTAAPRPAPVLRLAGSEPAAASPATQSAASPAPAPKVVPAPPRGASRDGSGSKGKPDDDPNPPPAGGSGRPALKRVK